MNLKYLLIGGLAIALASCADDALKGNVDNSVDMSESSLKSATVTVGQLPQTRASNVDSWSMSEDPASKNWDEIFNYTLPSDAVDITKPNFNQNAEVYVVPEGEHGSINLNGYNLNNAKILYIKGAISFNEFNFPNGLKIYIDTKYTPENLGRNKNNLDIIVLEDGELTINDPSYNNSRLYIQGTVNFPNGFSNDKIGEIYNSGELNIGTEGKSAETSLNVKIYSNRIINIYGNIDFKAACESHGMMYVTGNFKTQNGSPQYICGIEVSGKFETVHDNFTTSYLKAETIELNGRTIKLLPEALVDAGKIIMKTSNCAFKAYKGSHALIRTEDIELTNKNDFQNSFSESIYFEVKGSIIIEEIITRDNGQNDNLINTYQSVDDYIVSQNGRAVADRFNSDIIGAPACGPTYGDTNTPPAEVDTPYLELVAQVESHDHNEDKPYGRKLSATALYWDDLNETIYVSYHMRGGNYDKDPYDDDDVEGCIETWKFSTTANNETIIELGNYMWTKEFDFNHILVDGNDIITVGHKEDKGAIIGRLPYNFTDFNPPKGENVVTTSGELKYKYLTTEVPLRGEYENPNQGTTTEQKVDYENAGDGNCVIRVGENYFVATYAGYGLVSADDFKRVKDDNGNVAFFSTPGSAKHIVDKGDGEVAVLYLTDRPVNYTGETKTGSEIAILSKDTFPFGAETTTLGSFVQPVDGKNVLAWDKTNANYFACLGKGGLNVNGEIYKFGENSEPVNGVDFDDEYVYVAGGSHVRVLDRNSMTEVTHHTNPNMSANFVKVIEYKGEKYILAAYGQSGVKVFRLNLGKNK